MPTKKKNNKRTWLITTLALVVVGILGLAGWYAYRTILSPYRNWKTYTSPLEKFSVRYPSDWRLDPNASHNSDLVSESISITDEANDFSVTYNLIKDSQIELSATQRQAIQDLRETDPTDYNQETSDNGVVGTITPKNLGQPLYLVASKSNSGEPTPYSIEVSADKVQGRQFNASPYYLAKNQKGYAVQWQGFFELPTSAANLASKSQASFLANKDIKAAILMLKSISYPAAQ